MQAISVFLDIIKDADFRLKNANISRTQGVYHVTDIFFGSPLGKVYLCQVLSLQDMCGRFQGRWDLFAPHP